MPQTATQSEKTESNLMVKVNLCRMQDGTIFPTRKDATIDRSSLLRNRWLYQKKALLSSSLSSSSSSLRLASLLAALPFFLFSLLLSFLFRLTSTTKMV